MPPLKPKRSVSIQPRFHKAPEAAAFYDFETFTTWALETEDECGPVGSDLRERYLTTIWKDEPILAGAISTWVDRLRTMDWVVEGGRNNAALWARILAKADKEGWDHLISKGGLDFVTTNRGWFIELARARRALKSWGREGLGGELTRLEAWDFFLDVMEQYPKIEALNWLAVLNGQKAVPKPRPVGRVREINHFDALRMYVQDDPEFPAYYEPATGEAVKVPFENLIHIAPLVSPREEDKGLGLCAVERCLQAAKVILAILDYELQKLGKLPPLAIATVKGMTFEQFKGAWNLYKLQREQKGLDKYSGIFWLTVPDYEQPIGVDLTPLSSLPDQFNRDGVIETWVKTVALNLGVDVGEFWLIQHSGATKALQEIQHEKMQGKGPAAFTSALERRLNHRVLPLGVTFKFDFTDTGQDEVAARIRGIKIDNLRKLMMPEFVGLVDPLVTREQALQLAVLWDIIPPAVLGRKVPTALGAAAKSREPLVWVDRHGCIFERPPEYKPRVEEMAYQLYKELEDVFGSNGRTIYPIQSFPDIAGAPGIPEVVAIPTGTKSK